jgi:hypothetical protein
MALYQFDIYSEKLELIASEVMGFEEKVHARAKAGRLAKKHNGPVDVATYDPDKDFDERYITTAYPSVHTRSGYYFERIEN